MTDRAPVGVTNLDRYGFPALPWSRPRDLLVAGPPQPDVPGGETFVTLGTCRPAGRPHAAGIGACWLDGDFYFTSGPGTRKSRNLAATPACTMSLRLEGIDLILEGEAARVVDPATLARVATLYREGGWPAEVAGDALTAPFSAPSAGPPPWQLYCFTFHTAFGVATAEPYGATRWRFRPLMGGGGASRCHVGSELAHRGDGQYRTIGVGRACLPTTIAEERTMNGPDRKESSVPELRTLMTGLALVESPRWHDGRLWFSDWGAQEVIAVDLDGGSEVVVHVPTAPFCIDWLPDGRLLIVSGGDGRVLRREPDGSLVTHADLTGLSGHPWNDIVVDGRGNAYIGNIGFDFPVDEFRPGIVALVTPDGAARPVADGTAFANGLVVTPDNSTLILAESYASRLTAFDIAADGSLSNRRVWADLAGGTPDGICLDAEGAVWYGDPGAKSCVRVREGSEVLRTIALDRGCFACALGGADRRTLFLLANELPDLANGAGGGARTGQVLTAEAPAPGVGWP